MSFGAAAEVGQVDRCVGASAAISSRMPCRSPGPAWCPRPAADAIFALDLADRLRRLPSGARSCFAVPAQNLALRRYVSGNIGYQAPGTDPAAPRRPLPASATWAILPSPGWDSQWDWQGWVAFEDLPWTLNPPDGVIVAANQQVTASATPFLTSEWDYGWRSQRIRELLTDTPGLTVADMARIQGDTRNQFAPTLVAALLSIDLSGDPFTREAQDLLRTWDFSQPGRWVQPASAAAAYLQRRVVHGCLQATVRRPTSPGSARRRRGSRWWMAVSALLRQLGQPLVGRQAHALDRREPRRDPAPAPSCRPGSTSPSSLGSNIARAGPGARLHSLTLDAPRARG
jgi:penicillin amidase